MKEILNPKTENCFEMTVDHQAEACYIRLYSDPIDYHESMSEDVVFDYNKYGDIVGIEILRDVKLVELNDELEDDNEEEKQDKT